MFRVLLKLWQPKNSLNLKRITRKEEYVGVHDANNSSNQTHNTQNRASLNSAQTVEKNSITLNLTL